MTHRHAPHAFSNVCTCDYCGYERVRGFAEASGAELRKAAAAAGEPAGPLMQEVSAELAAFVADPARPETSWNVTKPDTGALAAVVRIQRPSSSAVTKGDPTSTELNTDPRAGVVAPDWAIALQQQVSHLQQQLRAGPGDLPSALRLIAEMHKALLNAQDEKAAAKDTPATPPAAVAKAAEQGAWPAADIGRSARSAVAIEQLRTSAELRLADAGAAVRHDEAREPMLAAAAKRLKLSDVSDLRPARELGLSKATASEHDERREDLLLRFAREVAG